MTFWEGKLAAERIQNGVSDSARPQRSSDWTSGAPIP